MVLAAAKAAVDAFLHEQERDNPSVAAIMSEARRIASCVGGLPDKC